MAKRTSPEEKPWNPVEAALTRSVLRPDETHEPAADPSPAPAQTRVVSLDAHRLQAPPAQEPEEEKKEEPPTERLTREKRYLVSETEEDGLEGLAKEVGRKLGTPVKLSHLIRAATSLLLHSRDEVLKQSERMGKLKRPPNNDPAALAAFEHNLARVLDRAIRGSRILD